MVTSDFRPEVEVRPFHACTMKNTQYNPYLWPQGMQTRSSDENSVCLSVCLSVKRVMTNGRTISADFLYHTINHLT